MVDSEFALEAAILKNPEKAYDNLAFMERSKEEIDDIIANSWWLDRFDV